MKKVLHAATTSTQGSSVNKGARGVSSAIANYKTVLASFEKAKGEKKDAIKSIWKFSSLMELLNNGCCSADRMV